MTTTLIMPTTALRPDEDAVPSPDEAQLAAAAFLARYSGRTLEAYRQDLRSFFQWATDQHLMTLAASRAHIEIYRSTMEQRGLAASTIDRRLSTVCGYYRFAHVDGRIAANPAQYVRRPRVQPAEQHAMDRGELGRFLFSAEHYDRAHAALAVLLGLNGLRVSEACATIYDRRRQNFDRHAAYIVVAFVASGSPQQRPHDGATGTSGRRHVL
jgi:integrase/recombinase XerD